MGTLITLGINKMEIDWGKNNSFNNHSVLFQKDDFEQDIPYYYFDDGEEIVKMTYEKGAKKQLSEVKERLEILGYDLASIEEEYNAMLKEYNFYIDEKVNLTFEEFKTLLISLDVSKVDNVSSGIINRRRD